MQNEQWEKLLDEIKRKFKVVEEKVEDILGETSDGLVKQGFAEIVIFDGPAGRMKLVRENRPVVLDKKFIYSHRGGSAARTEYTFSDSEFSHKLRAFRWVEDDEEWKEIDASSLG